MKICFLAAASLVHTVRWVNAMVEQGHEVHLITMHKPKQDKIHPDVHMHFLKFPAPLGYYLNFIEAKYHLKTIKPDILHVHYASGYGTTGRLVNYNPTILSVWGTDVFIYPKLNKLNKRNLIKNLAATHRITSTSKTMKEVTEQYVKSPTPIEVIPFGVDTNVFQPKKDINKDGTIVIGTVKRLEEVYGIDILIKAMARVVKHFQLNDQSNIMKRLKLMLIGDGSQRESLEKLAADLKIEHLTEFVGNVPHDSVPKYLNELDIYCAFSRSESFGVAILEASACECPVVVNDVGGIPEVVKDNKTGFVVNDNNISEITSKLVTLIQDENLRFSMGKNGREFVKKYYDWNHNIEEMDQLYREVKLKQSL